MITAPKPTDEPRRLAALRALNILDTDPEERFDRITRLAQRLFDTQMATVTLIDADRQWFKAARGMVERENARATSFCGHAILSPETMVVADALRDERFFDNPKVVGEEGVRFYAGHPIQAPGGEAVGTLCVIDDKPRDEDDFDAEALRELAEMVEAEIASLSLAIGDELTGLANRRGFEMLGERLLKAADRMDLPVSVLYADLDNMKPINDEFGHEAGDRALREIADVLESALRGSDLIARLGGDEFCAILVDAAAGGAAGAVARVDGELASRNEITSEPFDLSLSLGWAERPAGDPVALAALLGAADEMMFAAKRARKGEGAR